MACTPCFAASGTLGGLVVCFLITIYLLGLRKMGAWESRKDFNLPISSALAQTPTTYGLSVALAVAIAAITITIECLYPKGLRKATIPVVALFGVCLIVAICVTHKRQSTVHYVFTGLTLALMVAAAGLWTHASWITDDKKSMKIAITILTAMLGLAALGAGISFSMRTKQQWLAIMEWVSVALFIVILICSCSTRGSTTTYGITNRSN